MRRGPAARGAAGAPRGDRRRGRLRQPRDRAVPRAARPRGRRRAVERRGRPVPSLPRRAPRRAGRDRDGRGRSVHRLHAVLEEVDGGREARARAGPGEPRDAGAPGRAASRRCASWRDLAPDPAAPAGRRVGARGRCSTRSSPRPSTATPTRPRLPGAAPAPRDSRRTCTSGRSRRARSAPRRSEACEAAARARSEPASTASSASSRGASSSTTSSSISRASREESFRPEFDRMPWRANPGRPRRLEGGPHRVTRSSTPRCASSRRRTGCTTARGWSPRRSSRRISTSTGARARSGSSDELADADLANNNGGWQWAAGTGTDAAPYFRIFSPVAPVEAVRSRTAPTSAASFRSSRACRTTKIHEPWTMTARRTARSEVPDRGGLPGADRRPRRGSGTSRSRCSRDEDRKPSSVR